MKNTTYAYRITAKTGEEFVQYHANLDDAIDTARVMLARHGLELNESYRMSAGECREEGVPEMADF